jgi:hypothetical protein
MFANIPTLSSLVAPKSDAGEPNEERENYFVDHLPGAALPSFADPGLLSFAPMGQVSLASRAFTAAQQHRPTKEIL